MLFNSLQFAVFFIAVYLFYLLFKHRAQNIFLLVVSCIFYIAWDWRFLFLIFTTIITDYLCSLKIYASADEKARKRYLFLSLLINLSILGFFKYFNFFGHNLEVLLGYFGIPVQSRVMNIVLPVGISFYTFKSISYTVDVYRKEMPATRNFWDYALFVLYFPQLLAGPISRAKDLLPQISASRKITLDKFYEGCYLIFWGIFQKVFIADNLAMIVDPIFANSGAYNGAKVMIGIYAFAFQIYCDFAGYSNIAVGLGRCMGFDTVINFNLPYFSVNPKEFWKRWHISLSSWLRDYLYIPLGGNRGGAFMTYRNILITMFLGGLWHGAAWTFVIWGAYHGILLIMHRIISPLFAKVPLVKGIFVQKVWFFLKVIFFFHLVCLGWLIFRAESMAQVYEMLSAIGRNFSFINSGASYAMVKIFFYVWLLLVVQTLQYRKNDLLSILKAKTLTRAVFYYICFYLLIIFGATGIKEFIYFQF